MDTISLAEAWQRSGFATDLSPEATTQLLQHARWVQCGGGTILFREGELHDTFYIIHRGHVTLDMCLPARGCTRLITLGPGEMLAWSALVGNRCMTATAMAVDETQLIAFSGTELLQQCDADPRFGYQLMRRLAALLAKRLLATRLQMLDMFGPNVAELGGELP